MTGAHTVLSIAAAARRARETLGAKVQTMAEDVESLVAALGAIKNVERALQGRKEKLVAELQSARRARDEVVGSLSLHDEQLLQASGEVGQQAEAAREQYGRAFCSSEWREEWEAVCADQWGMDLRAARQVCGLVRE